MEILVNSLPWFVIGYLLTSAMDALHTLFNVQIRKIPNIRENGIAEAYERTRKYHPIYNLILLAYTSWLFLRGEAYVTLGISIQVGFIWLVLDMVLDMLLGVLIKHPFAKSWKDYYIKSQPWITLSYLAVLIAPMLGYVLAR